MNTRWLVAWPLGILLILATCRTLGTKMFTRIKDEREQAILRAFLAQGTP
jgi:hypothetical protein